MKKFFKFIYSTLDFLKIVIIFTVLMMLLYWISVLKSADWNWLNFIKPFLESLLNTASSICSQKIVFKDFSLEYKYPIALTIQLLLIFGADILRNIFEKFEDKCDDARRAINKAQENSLNKNLKQAQEAAQGKISNYRIYISTSLKKKFSHAELGYNIEDQNRIMNKFLIEKLGVAPSLYKDGFLYKLDSFDNIDEKLVSLFKLINSNSPLDYIICIQLLEGNNLYEDKMLDYLIDLKIENNISMLSNVAYRYKFNKAHRFGTSQLGLYQKDNNTLEVFQFIEIS